MNQKGGGYNRQLIETTTLRKDTVSCNHKHTVFRLSVVILFKPSTQVYDDKKRKQKT